MYKKIITETIALFFVLLFLYAAVSKLIIYPTFLDQIRVSPIFRPFSGLISVMTPLIEIVISLLLIIPITRKKGLIASFILMSMFTMYIIAILALSAHVPCSCGGVISHLSWKQHLIFNTCSTGLAYLGIKLESYTYPNNRQLSTM